ncbi:MAG TPA: hypothetical protein VNZ67_02020 [bacterium]|jgi:hypothetical protein|nr:hypothetical protein [bacterium]
MAALTQSPLDAELHALRQKADQQVTSHSYLRDHYLGWGQRLNLYTLFFSAVLLVFTLASDEFIQRTVGLGPDGYKWAIGTAAFFTFCISLIELAWNPSQKAKAHDQAVAHYLRMNYEIRHLLTTEGKVSREKVRWIQEEYLDANDLPRIPEARSLWLKQRHLLKLAVGRALERNPHQSLWWLRIKLWWKPGPPPDTSVPMALPPPERKLRQSKS